MSSAWSAVSFLVAVASISGPYSSAQAAGKLITQEAGEREASSQSSLHAIRNLVQLIGETHQGNLDANRIAVLPGQHQINGCQLPDRANGLASNRVTFVAAEDFAPEVNGLLTTLRWWGAYTNGITDCYGSTPDSFEIRYYADAGGIPGALLAGPYSQTNGTLSVDTPVATGVMLFGFIPEYEFVGVHDPVSVSGQECYWVEISNAMSDCGWFWETSLAGNARSLQDGTSLNGYDPFDARQHDMAFCVNVNTVDAITCLPVTPENDDCYKRLTITDGTTVFDSTNCTTDGSAEPSCNFSTDNDVRYDIWFDYVATCNSLLTVGLCGSSFDTRLAIYSDSNCPPTSPPLVCDDDRCGTQATRSVATLPVTVGQHLTIRVGSAGKAWGPGQITLTCGTPPVGSCCTANGTPGCIEPACREDVCACDPFCCTNEWDDNCAFDNQLFPGCDARSLCPILCGESDCCLPRDTPGCLALPCETVVCACDPWCCSHSWDFNCAVRNSRLPGCEAPALCPDTCSDPCPNRPDLNGNARIDFGEVAWLIGCLRGPISSGNSASCNCSDYDGDADVDLLDFARQQALFDGP